MSEQDRRVLAVILHADVAGSTELVRRNETLAHSRIQEVFQRFSRLIRDYGGITRELRGDALLAEFSRASDAVCVAVSFQQSNLVEEQAEDMPLQLRIGIAMG